MTNQIQKVLKQALVSFSSRTEVFSHNLTQLASILEKLTADDVKLNIKDVEGGGDGAPVTYIDIYEDRVLTMGIFVLKSNKKLPLHNHPEMYGLIKVLSGKIKVISYSLNTPKTIEADSMINFTNEQAQDLSLHKFPQKRTINAELVSTDLLDTSSKPVILDPNNRNIHEIHSIDGPAAFLDILAPPYMTRMTNGAVRFCSYYSIVNNILPNVFRLQETRNPSWYWTDTAPYLGPDPTAELKIDKRMN